MWKSLAILLVAVWALPVQANIVTLDFNEFVVPWDYDFSRPYRADYDHYVRDGVALTPASVYETYWANQYPDALLANYELNGSGILRVFQPIEITTGGRFKLDSVDLLSGLYSPGMSVVFDAYLDGHQTASMQVFFPPADPNGAFAAYIGDMSWLFGFAGESLGIVDRLVVSGLPGHRGGHSFFADNLVVRTNVPEPSTLALLMLGLCGVAAGRRRMKG